MATVLTQVGEEAIVDLIDAAAVWKYVAWGTGAGTAGKGDTTLFTEASEARTTGTPSQPLADKYQVVGTIVCAGAPKTITNAGVFNQLALGGSLLVKGDFTGIPLLVSDSIQFTFTLEIT